MVYMIENASQTIPESEKEIHNYSERTIKNFWSKVDKRGEDECWLWIASKNSRGYGNFTVNDTAIRANRFSFVLHGGTFEKGPLVLHSCHNPPCVNPKHLRSGTPQDNMDDRTNSGRAPMGDNHPSRKHPEKLARGSKNGWAKLNEQKVTEIKTMLSKGVLHKTIAALFSVNKETVGRINRNQLWKHVA